MSDDARAAAAGLWQKFRPRMYERLAAIDRYLSDGGARSEDQREAARREAHKLAGSLGMFGLHEGTDIARELENSLAELPPDGGPLILLAARLRAVLDAHE